MKNMWEIQTDLAVELQESMTKTKAENEGVRIRKNQDGENGIVTTKIEITNEEGERAVGKPKGSYLTLEFPQDCRKETLCPVVERAIRQLADRAAPDAKTVLAVGLGNADMTADALGPETMEKLCPTRALTEDRSGLAVLTPGVAGQTGMESAEIIAGVCRQVRPDLVLAVDALAARSSLRLGRTIQLNDSGICPGSGIGNSRQELSQKTLGVPVIAIGVPTVVSAAAIACDALDAMKEVFRGQNLLGSVEELNAEEQRNLVLELLMPRIGTLYVAPKDMDAMVLSVSSLLADALNHLFAKIGE